MFNCLPRQKIYSPALLPTLVRFKTDGKNAGGFFLKPLPAPFYEFRGKFFSSFFAHFGGTIRKLRIMSTDKMSIEGQHH